MNARETRGRGAARASIESTLAQVDGRTEVGVVTDRNLSGSVAQYGRGIVQDVTEQLVAQFAACLQNQLAAEPGTEASAGTDPVAPPPPKPVSGGRLVLKALWGSIARLFRRG